LRPFRLRDALFDTGFPHAWLESPRIHSGSGFYLRGDYGSPRFSQENDLYHIDITPATTPAAYGKNSRNFNAYP